MTDRSCLLKAGGGRVRKVGTSEAARARAYTCSYDYSAGRKMDGARTKVEAGIRAADAGIDAYWAHASENFQNVFTGHAGTHFVAKGINR